MDLVSSSLTHAPVVSWQLMASLMYLRLIGGWLGLQVSLSSVSLVASQPGLLHLVIVHFSRAAGEGKCTCVKYFLHLFFCIMFGIISLAQARYKACGNSKGRKRLPLHHGRGSTIILQWHEYEEGKNLWPFLQLLQTFLMASHLGQWIFCFEMYLECNTSYYILCHLLNHYDLLPPNRVPASIFVFVLHRATMVNF